ncbi:MAG: hypothetical protein H6838_07795 [Planctomycetes bacterium]|nr:hypothetical protein [Planctomycetota bacterium]
MKKLLRNLLPALLVLGACASNHGSEGAAMAMNKTCPVSGEALEADSPTVDFHGATIAFCCKNCLAKFEKMDEAAKQAAVDKVTK